MFLSISSRTKELQVLWVSSVKEKVFVESLESYCTDFNKTPQFWLQSMEKPLLQAP